MFDLFGDYGVWKSPGGKAKEYIHDQIKVKATWYENNSLILKGDIGERLKHVLTQKLETNTIVIDPQHNCELSTPAKEPNIYNTVNELQSLTKDVQIATAC